MRLLNYEDGLMMPESMAFADEKKFLEMRLNRCGPDGPISYLIPNSLLGVDISASCNIHDWTFIEAQSEWDHIDSDKLFLKNMKTQINKEQASSLLKYARLGLAHIYFGAVRIYSFLKKNTSQNSKKIPCKYP